MAIAASLQGRCADIQRRFEAKHCSSLCSQSEGANIMATKHELKIQQSHSSEALTMFATCSWPSLCEQSELQCWRRNRRLCGPVQISAARALPLTFDISILNPPSYASLLFVKTIITPAVPNKKSSIRGRKQHYLRPPVVLPPAASSTNGGRGSITSYRSCWDMVVFQAPPFFIPQKSGKSTLRPSG